MARIQQPSVGVSWCGKDEIATTARPATQRKALYASIVAHMTPRTLHELFEADRPRRLANLAK